MPETNPSSLTLGSQLRQPSFIEWANNDLYNEMSKAGLTLLRLDDLNEANDPDLSAAVLEHIEEADEKAEALLGILQAQQELVLNYMATNPYEGFESEETMENMISVAEGAFEVITNYIIATWPIFSTYTAILTQPEGGWTAGGKA